MQITKPDIRALTIDELKDRFQRWGDPSYRVEQLLEWLYVRMVSKWEDMSNLPKSLRQRLSDEFSLRSLALMRKQGSSDITQKFLWKLVDDSLVESVLIPANPALYGETSDRHTLCVSTQVGCAYGCKFCASGLDGLKRNLEVEEIVEQVLAVERLHASDVQNTSSKVTSGAENRLVNNLVIMGMGEPLANYDNLLKALRILNAPWGGRIGARKITISTSGLAPQIRRLADEPLQFQLALSLHGATDEVRNRIMPVNRKYPIQALSDACAHYLRTKGRMITIEYILIADVNDGMDQIKPLAQLARRFHAKVNLIPYNKVDGLPWQRPDEKRQNEFSSALSRLKVSTTLRREKGTEIDAACGQLRLKTERERQ